MKNPASLQWDYSPHTINDYVFMDLETQSTVDLKEKGVQHYVRHPDTRIMSGVFLNGSTCVVWCPTKCVPQALADKVINKVTGYGFDNYTVELIVSDEVPDIIQEWAKSKVWVAHNAEGFDALAWQKLSKAPEPVWFDTLNIVRAIGLPGGIDALGKLFFNYGKDDKGKKAMLLLCKATPKKGKIVYNVGTVALWEMLLRYNIIDVLIMRHAFAFVGDSIEREVLDTHAQINDRGIQVDVDFLKVLWGMWTEVEAETYKRISELTGGIINSSNIRSTKAVKEWLEKQGLQLYRLNDSISKQNLEAFYNEPEEFLDDNCDDEGMCRIIEVLKLRSMATRTSKAKLTRMLLDVDESERLRYVIQYHKAHTGRDAGKGVQPHNLAKGHSNVSTPEVLDLYSQGKLDFDTVKELCLKYTQANNECRSDDLLTTVLRPVFCAKPGHSLGICDYASIEARKLNYLCGETWVVDEFRKPGADVYVITASKIYGREVTKKNKDERQVGKITELGCGYGMGEGKFAIFCEQTKPRIDLTSAGTSAKACIKAYRDSHKAVVRQWKHYELAALEAVRHGKIVKTGRCTFFTKDGCLVIQLPSGRRLTYRAVEIRKQVPNWALVKGLQVSPKDTLCYRHPYGYYKTLYGGLLAENITQASSSCLLREARNKCRYEGINVVMHIHDEIIIEAPDNEIVDQTKRLAEIMSTSPEWARDFPVAIEGHTHKRYVKSAYPGNYFVEALNGKVYKDGIK
jgi:DNA polymerase